MSQTRPPYQFRYRDEVIRYIDMMSWRQRFEATYGRSPEEYYAEYGHLEPDVWDWTLGDIEAQIDYDV